MTWFVGVDVGGTFTDFFAFDAESGRVELHKTPSTPEDPSRAILEGLALLDRERGVAPASIRRLGHGTTVATNALIQRRGGRVAMITTGGFRDLLEIGRQTRPKMYDLRADHPPPLVAREHRFEIAERVGPRGEILTALSGASIREVVGRVRESGAEACAVCLLFAFRNPEHERRIAAALEAAAPGLFLSLSSSVQPEFREFERFSTTVQNAYLQPVLTRYLRALGKGLERHSPAAAIGINQSSGGLMSIGRAGDFPIRTALSGPAAGAVGAVDTARRAGRDDAITLDMGGTSADVCLITGGEARMSHQREVAGFPVRLPMVDIQTVGAGGGSIAWFDRDGLLKVGPASAGAAPGPACYGRGGTAPTVSDANLLLGRLGARGLLGGRMALDREAATRAMTPAAERLGMTVERAAHGVIGIVVANMVRAVRAVSVERGYDPRDFALLAMGGAGPLHASDVARALGMRTVLVPPAPGILCAQGLVMSDLREDFIASGGFVLTDESLSALRSELERLARAGAAWAIENDLSEEDYRPSLSFDMRYVGQNFELRVPVTDAFSPAGSLPAPAELRRRFFAAHDQSYGFHDPEAEVEIVNLRMTAHGRVAKPAFGSAAGDAPPPSPVGRRQVWFEADSPVQTPVFDRTSLRPGHGFAGPAVIEQLDATTLVLPGDSLCVDAAGNLLIEVSP